MPRHTCLLPLGEPVELGARLDEELHLHLLELAHTENELAGHDLVAEGLTNLCDTEGELHAARLLHVEVVDEDALGGLGAQVDGGGSLGGAAYLGLEHEVELAHVGPIAGAADGAYNFLVDDDLLQLVEVVGVHGLLEALVEGVALALKFKDAAIGGTELCLVKGIAEALAGLGDFLVDLLIVLGHLVLNEDIGAIALLRIAVVDEGVVESIHVTAGLPRRGVHENSGIDADDVLMQEHHRLPPVLLDVVLQLHAVLSVVIDSAEAIVDIT